jgi:upstream activation factor subunit UAF30
MPKQSKSTKTEVAETTTAPVVNEAPKKEVKPKESKPKKEAKPKTEPVVASEPTQTTSAPEPVAESAPAQPTELATMTAEFATLLNQVGTQFNVLKAQFKALEKRWTKELKNDQKSQAKKKKKSGNRQPSGFVKPTKISDELASFLGKEKGSEMARTDVTREINKYIVSQQLQDKENGRKINPDAKLQKLLKLKQGEELTYFNLQKYMSQHFAKAVKAVTA